MELMESFACMRRLYLGSGVCMGDFWHHNVVMVEADCVGDALCTCTFYHNLIAPIVPHCWANVPA
eukprot:12799035-Ditylum_brightwellii.AAC.2